MALSPEYQTMVRCTVELIDTLADNVPSIGDQLWAHGVISPGLLDVTKSTLKEPKQKSRELINSLTTKIKTSPNSFYDIVGVLVDQGEWIQPLIRIMKKQFEEFGGTNFPQRSLKENSTDRQPPAAPPEEAERQVPRDRSIEQKPAKDNKPNRPNDSFCDRERREHGGAKPHHSNNGGRKPVTPHDDVNRQSNERNSKAVHQTNSTPCSWFKLSGGVFVIVVATLAIGAAMNGNKLRPWTPEPSSDDSIQGGCHLINTKGKRLVYRTFGELGNWEKVCLYLDVSEGRREEILNEQIQVANKIIRCLDTYFDSNSSPCFEDVVSVLCNDLRKRTLAVNLAKETGVDYNAVCDSKS